MDKRHIKGLDKDGNEVVYDVILTFHNDDNDKDYIVYTNNEIDEENKLKIYSSVYNPTTDELLGNPETKEEWDRIFSLLDEVFK